MATFDPTLFDPALHSWEEIAQAMCQAELVHVVIVVLSFVPLAFVPLFGVFPVFFVERVVCLHLIADAHIQRVEGVLPQVSVRRIQGV